MSRRGVAWWVPACGHRWSFPGCTARTSCTAGLAAAYRTAFHCLSPRYHRFGPVRSGRPVRCAVPCGAVCRVAKTSTRVQPRRTTSFCFALASCLQRMSWRNMAVERVQLDTQAQLAGQESARPGGPENLPAYTNTPALDRRFSIGDNDEDSDDGCDQEPAASAANIVASVAQRASTASSAKDVYDRRFSIDGDPGSSCSDCGGTGLGTRTSIIQTAMLAAGAAASKLTAKVQTRTRAEGGLHSPATTNAPAKELPPQAPPSLSRRARLSKQAGLAFTFLLTAALVLLGAAKMLIIFL